MLFHSTTQRNLRGRFFGNDTKVAYVVNGVVRSYATFVYSQCICGRCLISLLYPQKVYMPLAPRRHIEGLFFCGF